MRWAHRAAAAVLAAVVATSSNSAVTKAGGNIYSWPDLSSGMWAPNMAARFKENGPLTQMAFTPAAQAAGKAAQTKKGGSGSCSPMGPIGQIAAGFPLKFYYSPGEIIIMSDMDQLIVRHVYMDGRKHPADVDESYNGHSVGHWEGKTLVIDTVGLSPKVELGDGVAATPRTHVVERYTLTSPERMHLSFSVDDPSVMTATYKLDEDFIHHGDWEIQDTYCGEGNRDATDASGKESLDLTPPQ